MIEKSSLKIIAWWEIRRLLLNIVMIAGIALSLWLLGISLLSFEMGSGEYFVLLIFIGHLVVTNVIYTFGWIIELFISNRSSFATRFFWTILALSFAGLVALTGSLLFLLEK